MHIANSNRIDTGIPAAEKVLHLRKSFDDKIHKDGLLSAAILKELHEPTHIQSVGRVSTAIIASPRCEGITQDDAWPSPLVHPPEPSYIPIPKLLACAEPVMTGGIPQSLDEAQGSSGCDNCCPSNPQQPAEADPSEKGWEKTRQALLNGTVDDNASFKIPQDENGVTLILSNLPSFVKVCHVVGILKEHGCCENLLSLYMPTHKTKRYFKGRGYSFLRFDCSQAALRCFDAFNGRYFGASSKQCVVELAYKQGFHVNPGRAQ